MVAALADPAAWDLTPAAIRALWVTVCRNRLGEARTQPEGVVGADRRHHQEQLDLDRQRPSVSRREELCERAHANSGVERAGGREQSRAQDRQRAELRQSERENARPATEWQCGKRRHEHEADVEEATEPGCISQEVQQIDGDRWEEDRGGNRGGVPRECEGQEQQHGEHQLDLTDRRAMPPALGKPLRQMANAAQRSDQLAPPVGNRLPKGFRFARTPRLATRGRPGACPRPAVARGDDQHAERAEGGELATPPEEAVAAAEEDGAQELRGEEPRPVPSQRSRLRQHDQHVAHQQQRQGGRGQAPEVLGAHVGRDPKIGV
jgi:hypothetical protein